MKTVVIQLHLAKKKFSTIYRSGRCQESTKTGSSRKQQQRSSERNTNSCHEDENTAGGHLPFGQFPRVVESSVSGRPATLNDLPNELLQNIFSHLPNEDKFKAAQVCKRWNSIVYDRINWTWLKFSNWDSS